MHDYNSTRPPLMLPENGRHIQNMVMFMKNEPSKTKRNELAQSIIHVLGQLHAHLRDVPDFKHKLWDHIFITAGFDLDIDSPYPKPEAAVLMAKPDPLKYPNDKILYKHYGKNVQRFVEHVAKYNDNKKKEDGLKIMAGVMKRFYSAWNSGAATEKIIKSDLEILTNHQINMPISSSFNKRPRITK